MRKLFVIIALILVGALLPSARAEGDFQGATHMVPFDEGILNYNKAAVHDAITDLQAFLDGKEATLEFSKDHGYLDSVLAQLKIPKSSQVLVFSKTSFQRERISPTTPRALFFNDDVYIGFIPGSPMMEVSTADPKLGAVFYTLDQNTEHKPKFTRQDQCLECHASAKSMGVPGHLLRSFMTDESGVVELNSGISEVNHRTPIEDRWGGWYVTGKHGSQPHRGNLIGKEAFADETKKPNHLGNLTDLSPFFDVTRYPGTNSDIVALMVLEHQTHMHNFITRLRDETELRLSAYGHIDYVTNIAESFLKYLLFTEEATIKSPIEGASSFAKDFARLGPFDRKGRSLRQFDLETRLFKYPCSYLIYSKSFNALPEQIKSHLYRRLYDILTDKDHSPDFAEIPRKTKRAILEILAETKKDLPEYWRSAQRAAK
ncbi:MAG: hypothetical protein JWM68_5812 [Verrucomicrobiales bacterium]|nr:hypothetical protein [Verrucomicrobiales bacterium]